MPALSDVLECRIVTHMNAQSGINVLHYQVSAITGGGASLLDIATALSGFFAPPVKGLISNSAEFRGVGVRWVKGSTLSTEVTWTAGAGPGTAGADALPAQVTGMITKRTGVPGKSKRGRVYVPFPAEAHNLDDLPTAAYMTALAAYATQIATIRTVMGTPPLPPGDQIELRPVVMSKALGTEQEITHCVSRQRWATQRRRGNYGKNNLPPF